MPTAEARLDRLERSMAENTTVLNTHMQTCERQGRETLLQIGALSTSVALITASALEQKDDIKAMLGWQSSADRKGWFIMAAIGSMILTGVISFVVVVGAARVNAPVVTTTSTFTQESTVHAHAR